MPRQEVININDLKPSLISGTYSKSMTEDKLREEAKRLMEDKEKYQVAAKENLKNLGKLDLL